MLLFHEDSCLHTFFVFSYFSEFLQYNLELFKSNYQVKILNLESQIGGV